jgi:DNA-binding MarR family transcriptional regulator
MSGKLAKEIRQTKPFSSAAEEAILNIQRTASVLAQAFAETLKPHGLSETQYNALRILRGAGPKGLCCQEIAERMINRDPDITRLVDRLETRKLVERARSDEDRRVVVTKITGEGLKVLAAIDAEAKDMPKQVIGHLGEKRLRILIGLLERAREMPDE